MGLDGFSMSNLGLHRNLTTAQLANEVEATAKMALENQLPDVDGIGKKEKAGKKDPEAAFNPTVPFIPDKKKNDGEEEQQNPQQQSVDIKDTGSDTDENTVDIEIEEPRYLFKMNKEDDMIEIYDAKTGKVIRKITPEEAASCVHNFTKLPGLFFNKGV